MLTVRDIMNTEVVTVSPGATVRELTRVLVDAEISGTPVVDSYGTLVGVVSNTDVVRLAAHQVTATDGWPQAGAGQEEDEGEADPYGFFLPEDSPFAHEEVLELLPEGEMDRVTVGDIMTAVSFSVGPETSVRDLAGFLVRGRIHRAVVVEDTRLVGIVTTMDILGAVAEGRMG